VSDKEIYEAFIDWLNKAWFNVPEADELVPLVKARYTPEEAELLTGMPFSTKTLAELAEMKQMDPAELGPKLDALAGKGLVYRSAKSDHVRYRLNDALFVYLRSAFWAGRSDEDSKAIAPLANRYYYNGFFEQYDDSHYKGLRTVPVDETVEDTRQILPYDDVVKIVNDQDYWSVSHCACRHRKNIDPDSPGCTYPTETCLHFGSLGRYIVENGMGREITREETIEILGRCADDGLVHGASNWEEHVDTICNCCKCCCLFLEAFHKLGHSGSLSPSNYRARIDVENCKGCGLCVKRCPMEAVHLEESPQANNKTGKVAVLDREICIGCGVCAHKCPAEAIVLEECEEIRKPARNAHEYMRQYLGDRKAAQAERAETAAKQQ